MTTRTAFLALIAAVAALAVGLFVAELQGDAVITRHARLPQLRRADRERRRAVPRLQSRVPAGRPASRSSCRRSSARRRTASTRAFETLMVIALIAAAVLIVLSLVALGGSTLEHRAVGRGVPRRRGAARPVRADALRPLRGHAHSGGGLRDPVPPASARAGAARGRDRDEDLPGRAPAAARGANVAAGGAARGADGARG